MLSSAFLFPPLPSFRRLRSPSAAFPLACTAPDGLPSSLADVASQSLSAHGLSLTSTVWRPPTLTAFIRRVGTAVSATADDCAAASRLLSEVLDETEWGGAGYILEVSTPGASEVLTEDYEFHAFKGFPVRVEMREEWKGRRMVEGSLVSRDGEVIKVAVLGRIVKVPEDIVEKVVLCKGVEE